MVEVRRATDDDWRRVRAIRLQALWEAPVAFASTYAREAAFADETWRARIAESASFLVEHQVEGDQVEGDQVDGDQVDGDQVEEAGVETTEVIGIATGYVDLADAAVVHLVGMYVVPQQRGRGLAAQLVDAVVDDAHRRGAIRMVLDVVESNVAARSAYERYGFVATGVTKPLPHRPDLTEIAMAYDIDRPTASQPGSVGPPK